MGTLDLPAYPANPPSTRSQPAQPTFTMKVFLSAIVASCLVAAIAADCLAPCNDACDKAGIACGLVPMIPGSNTCEITVTGCKGTCTSHCGCVDECSKACPPVSDQNPMSRYQNYFCVYGCHNKCQAQAAAAAFKQGVQQVMGMVKNMMGGAAPPAAAYL